MGFFLVNFLDAVRQRVQKFEVEYIGNLPVSRAMGEWSIYYYDIKFILKVVMIRYWFKTFQFYLYDAF